MTLNLVSPGVKVREVDLTIGRIDGAQEFVGAICGPFERGPVDVPILIENEQDLISTFGKPISSDRQYEYWMSASNYLSYGGILRVVRSGASTLNNANAKSGPVGGGNTADTDDTLQIKSYENYVDSYNDAAQSFRFAAKDPGTWANNLKICTIDDFADQTISVSVGLGLTDNTATTSDERVSGIWVGMGVTQTLNGRADTTGAGTTGTYDGGFLRGIITGLSTNSSNVVTSIDVKVTDSVTADGTSTNRDYEPGTEFAFEKANTGKVAADSTIGIGTTVAGTVGVSFASSITSVDSAMFNTVKGIFETATSGHYTTVDGGEITNGVKYYQAQVAGKGSYKPVDGELITFTFSEDGKDTRTFVFEFDADGGAQPGSGKCSTGDGGITDFADITSSTGNFFFSHTAQSTGSYSTDFKATYNYYTITTSGGLNYTDPSFKIKVGTGDFDDFVSITRTGDANANDTHPNTIGVGITVIGYEIAATAGTDTLFVSRPLSGSTAIGATHFDYVHHDVGAITTTNNIRIVGATGISTSDISNASMTVVDWYDQQKLGLSNASVYWKTIAPKPGTSEYASKHSSRNDELHVVVVDDEGLVTGIDSNIIEKHVGLSKAKDGKISPSENVYYRDYIALKSDYIYVSPLGDGVRTGVKAKAGNYEWTEEEVGNWGEIAQGNTFSGLGNNTWKLEGGKNYDSTDGYPADLGQLMTAYELFKNESEWDINFLINGPSAATKEGSIAKAKKLIEISELRKDCIATISPHREDVVGETDSDTQTDNVKAFFSGMNSSYAVFDSTWKYQYDRWNNQFVYTPCNPDIAGLMARTSINQYSWFSPAGTARGSINSAIKLAYNPSQAQRDIIYPAAINPITFSPGSGIILFGDRTGLKYASAFDRINVRRLFLTVENTIERAARAQLFEFNDVITRTNFVNIVEPYLRDIKSKRGITDFIVVCDETNNTPDIIDANQFKADIFIKPARSINFIGLTFVATRTGVSFEEVVGNV